LRLPAERQAGTRAPIIEVADTEVELVVFLWILAHPPERRPVGEVLAAVGVAPNVVPMLGEKSQSVVILLGLGSIDSRLSRISR